MTETPPQSEAAEWFAQGRAYMERGQWRDALRAFTSAVELEPGFVPAYVERGLIMLHAHLIEHALADFELAVQLDPSYALGYYGRALARHEQGDYRGELDDAQRGQELDPPNAAMYMLRIGVAYRSLREYDRALAAYDTLIDANPQDKQILYSRALCYVEMERNADALADIERALALDSAWPPALRVRAGLNARLHKHKRAYADIVAAGQRDPRFQRDRRIYWPFAHPVRLLLGIVATMAFSLFVLLSFTAPVVTPDSVVELSGSFVSMVPNQDNDLVLHLLGAARPLLVLEGDRPIFDETTFRADTHVGDEIAVSVLKNAARNTQPSQPLVVLQLRSERAVYLSLDATTEARRRERLTVFPIGVIVSLIVAGWCFWPLLHAPWRA